MNVIQLTPEEVRYVITVLEHVKEDTDAPNDVQEALDILEYARSSSTGPPLPE